MDFDPYRSHVDLCSFLSVQIFIWSEIDCGYVFDRRLVTCILGAFVSLFPHSCIVL